MTTMRILAIGGVCLVAVTVAARTFLQREAATAPEPSLRIDTVELDVSAIEPPNPVTLAGRTAVVTQSHAAPATQLPHQEPTSNSSPIRHPEDWSRSRLPSHTEILKDPELNRSARTLSLDEKKALATFVQERNRPIVMKVLQRDDRVQQLLQAKDSQGEREYGSPTVHERFYRQLPQSDGTIAFVALYPGEDDLVDQLDLEILEAIELARAEILAYLDSK